MLTLDKVEREDRVHLTFPLTRRRKTSRKYYQNSEYIILNKIKEASGVVRRFRPCRDEQLYNKRSKLSAFVY